MCMCVFVCMCVCVSVCVCLCGGEIPPSIYHVLGGASGFTGKGTFMLVQLLIVSQGDSFGPLKVSVCEGRH